MKSLKGNIDHYMEINGIKKYSDLLREIAKHLGIKGQDIYEFAKREKSNFTKMLKGERPLKYEFIIPLEKIFGVSLARLLDEDAYKLPNEKQNIPFDKGFRYYAALDNPELYKKEFDVLLASDGKSIITQTDEFGKTFLDYVVKYHSVNGVRYLHDEYGITLKWYHNQFESRKDKCIRWLPYKNSIEFARLVASMDDTELFYDIFDSYNMFFTNGHYATENCIFCQSEYLEILLDNDNLFRALFEKKAYELKLGSIGRRQNQVDSVTYHSINPIINNCLRYALTHLDKFKQRAIDILKFGIDYNRKIGGEGSFPNYYVCNELGGLKNCANEDYYDVIIFVDIGVDDDEISPLIDQLTKFNKSFLWE